jgi:hypothetical protein
VHEEPSRCLFVWQRAPGALRQIQQGLRAVLDLSRQQHPVLLLQPLDNLEVSIPTSNVDGQPARLGRGHQRHPVLLRQPLDQCPSPHAQCMGCEPSLALAVSDTPCCTASHLTSSRCPLPHAPCMGCKLRGLNSAVNDTPSCAANHLTTSRCPLTHAQCMGSHVFTTILIGLFCLVNREECMGNDSLYPRAHSPPGVHAPRT